MRKLMGVAASAATILTTPALAAEVFVANAEFSEGPAVAEGAYFAGHQRALPGWIGGGSGNGHWNPTPDLYADEAAHGGVAWTSGPIGLSTTGSFLGQVIQDLVIRANTRYTLTVDAGRYFGQPTLGDYDFGFIAGWNTANEFIAARSQGRFAQTGVFTPLTLVFETGADGPAIGKSLMIALGSDGGTAYDNIRLEATSLTGGVPEPAAWAMMIGGFGLAGGLLRRRSLAAAG